MNKIYRTVYNETTGTWVAVCETAKTHTKSSGKSSVVKAVAAVGMAAVAGVAMAGSVVSDANTLVSADGSDPTSAKRLKVEAIEAAGGVVQKDANGNYMFDSSGNPIVITDPKHTVSTTALSQIAVGDNAQSNAGGAVAVGSNAYAGGKQSVSVGMGASSNGGGAVAIGGGVSGGTLQGAIANGYGAVSIGVNSTALSEGAVSMGRDATAKSSAVAIGSYANGYGEGSVAIGGADSTYHTETYGKGTVAIGRNATAKASILQRDANGNIDESRLTSTTGNKILETGKASERHLAFDKDDAELTGKLALGQNIAIGDESQAYSHQSIAVGANTMALGVGAIAIGGDDLGRASDINKKAGDDGYDAGFTASMKTLKDVQTSLTQIRTDYKNKAELVGVLGEPKVITNTLSATAEQDKAYVDTTMAVGDGSLAIGFKSAAKGSLSDAIGMGAMAKGDSSLAVGTVAEAQGKFANAVGTAALAEGDNANAFGLAAIAEGDYSNAIGTSAASGEKSSAMGYMNRSLGENAVAIGTQNVSGSNNTNNTVAMGVENEATGDLSVAIGSNNKTEGEYATAYGKNNIAAAERSAAWGSENEVKDTATHSTAIGSNNTINAANVYAVGNNITADLANSVVLGAGSDGTETSKYVPTEQATIPTNGGANSITYGGFAGSNSSLGDGAIVSVGAKGEERQIKHVAAGQITADSTDAINGSQLYAVLGVAPVVYTDAQGNRLTKKGDKFFNGNDEVEPENVIASMNNGNSSTTNPMALQNVASHLAPVDSTYNAGVDHTKTAPAANIVSGGDTYTLSTPVDVETFRNNNAPALSQAATVGDVLNAGWNLQANSQAVDFVTHADTVNFKSSDNSITVKGEYDKDNISQIDLKANIEFQKGGVAAKNGDTADAVKLGDKTYNLGGGGSGENNWNLTVNGDNTTKTTAGSTRNLASSTTITPTINASTGDITFNANTVKLPVNDGKVTAPTGENANKLATAGDIANAINNTGWYVNSGASGGTNTGTHAGKKQLVKAGEEVNFIAGKGINIAQQGKDFTISNTMEIESPDSSITVTQDATTGNWKLTTTAGKTYKAGTNISIADDGTISANLPAGSGATQVVGNGSVKVDNPSSGSTYEVSVPVVSNDKGANATAANAGNRENSLAIGSGATIENATNKAGNNIAIGADAKIAKTAGAGIVIGNNSQISSNDNMVVIGNNIKTTGTTPDAVVIGSGSTNGTASSDLISVGDTTNQGQWGTAFEFSPETDDYANQFATFNVGDGQGKTKLRQIKGVANGQVEKGSTDAVTGDQLYSVAVAVANTGNSLAGGATVDANGNITGGKGVLGESFTVNTDGSYGAIGTITGKNIAGTGADNIEDAIKQSRTKVEAGQGVTVTDKTENGATTYTVNGLTVSGSTPATGGGNATATQLTGADGTVYDLAAGDENWNLTVNGNNQTTAGGKRNLKDTNNIKVSQTGEDISFDLANKVSIGGNQTGNSPIVIDGSGAKGTNKITGLAPNYTKQSGQIRAPKDAGGKDDQAATLGDVRNVGWNLKVNNQAKDFVNHDDTVNFADGKGTTVSVTQTGKQSTIQVDIKSAKDLTIDTANPKKMGRVVAEPNTANNILTSSQVAKAINTAYWNVGTGTDISAKDAQIHAGDRVGLVSGKGVKVTQSGNNFTFDSNLKAGNQIKITDNADGSQTIAYTGKDANTVTGVTVNNGQNATANAKDGGNLKLTEDKTDPANPTYDISLNDEIDLTDKGSLKVGGDDVANGSPVTNVTAGNIDFGDTQGSITNVASHLKDPASKEDAGQVMNPDNAPANFNSVKNEAATVGDVLNAGWNLKVGDTDADFVQHGDTVAFGNGKGTTAQYDATNGVISFDITKAKNPTVPTTGNNAGKVTGGTGDQYWDSKQVQTAINDSGWFVNSGAGKGGSNSGAAKTLVKAGEEVKFIAGDGMNIVQNGKEFTFNAKIVDANGNALKLDDKGNYVVNGGTGGSGKPFTVTANDNNGKPSTTTINGAKGEGSGVTFKGDENVKVIKQPTKGGDGTDVAVGLQDVVTVGGTQNDVNGGTPNKGAVTIDGTKGGNSIAISTDGKGNLKVGNSNKNNAAPIKITNVKAGANGTQDAVNVAQVEDVVGAANRNTKGSVSTKGSDGKEYTLKTYNVNGQTEYLTNNVVEAVSKMNEQGIKFFHVNDGTQKPVKQAKNNVDSQAFGKNSIAIGVKSTAKGDNSIVIGTENTVTGNNSIAIGDPTVVTGDSSVSLGNNNTISTNNTYALGSNITATAENSVFLGDKSAADVKGAGATGTVSNATVGDITYSGFAGETSVGMVSVGNASEVRRVSGVAAGEISATSTDAINGSQLYSALSNSGVYVTGNGAAPTDANLVKLGDKNGALNFVNGNGTTARVDGNKVTFDVVPGYTDGLEAGDNITLTNKQLKDQDGNPLYIDAQGNSTTEAQDAQGNPNQKQQTTVISAKQPDLRPIEQHVQQVENNAYAGVAQAMATAGLPQAYLPGKSMLAVSGGHYKGETGYALGLSSISDSGNWVFKATASGNSRGNVGGTIGAGYQW